MSQIFIANGQNNEALGHIRYPNILSNSHKKSLEDQSEIFDFTTHADKPYSQFVEGNNRVIIPGEDGEFLEFIIYEVQEDRIEKQLEVYSYGSYVELATAKVIDPQTTGALSAKSHGNFALSGTEWQMGIVDFKGTKSITFENYTNPYAYLKKIVAEFDLELRFRIEHDNGEIVGRYVDLLEKVGEWRGRRIELGKDLIGLKRIENTENIVTALKVIGPVREDGSRLVEVVEDKDALKRWGREDPDTGQLHHIIKEYETQTSDSDITVDELREIGRTELNKRINASVKYVGSIADLEHVPGLQNKKIRYGDTIQIKDTSYEPALYLEARIYFQDRDIVDPANKQVELGDYIEYTEEEVNAIWQSLQAQIAKKISMSDLEEVTYTQSEIDNKDDTVRNDAATDATQKANQAESDAKQYADSLKTQIDQEISDVNQSVTNLNNYVEGSFRDGIIQESEAKAVEKYLNTLNAEKDDIDAKYITIYGNADLTESIRQSLQDAKIDYNNKHSALIGAINNAIADGKATESDKLAVDQSFDNYAVSLSALTSAFEQAIDNIGQNKANQAEQGAKTHADNVAQQAENNAENYADQLKATIDQELLEKAGLTYVNGQLALKADSDTVQTINNTVNDLETTTSNLQTSVANHATELQEQGGKITTVETDLDTVKGDLSLAITDLSTLEGTVQQQGIDISANTQAISLKAEQSTVEGLQEEFENLQIGVRNLLIGTSEHFEVYDRTSTWGDFHPYNDVLGIAGETYTARVYLKSDPSNQKEVEIRARTIDGSGNWTDFVGNSIAVGEEGYSEVTFTMPSNRTIIQVFIVRFGSSESTRSIVEYKEAKLEKGTKATGWTQAPEDVEADITAVGKRVTDLSGEVNVLAGKVELKAERSALESLENNVTNVSNQVGELEVSYNGISAEVSNLETTIDGHTTDITNLNSDFNVLAGEVSSKVSATYVDNAVLNVDTHLSFDGLDDYIEVSNHSSLSITDAITIEFWMKKAESMPKNYSTTYRTLLSKGPAVARYSVNWITNGDQTSDLFNFDLTINGTRFDPRFNVSNGWHHVACTYDGSTLKMYVDGEEVNSQPANGLINTDSSPLFIGWAGSDRHFPGKMKDVRLWNVARSKQEINNNMDELLNISESGLVGCWKLNEATGDLAYDSANSLNGTISGATWGGVSSKSSELLDSRLDSATSSITQLAGEVETKAEASTVSSLETRTTTAEQNISALEGEITSKVEQSTYNALESRVDTAESTITQHGNQIALKVNENGVIAAINLSNETARIQAANIELQGAVTVLSDITGNLGSITAGEITGTEISASTIYSYDSSGNVRTFMGQGSIEHTNYSTLDHIDLENGKINIGMLDENDVSIYISYLELSRNKIWAKDELIISSPKLSFDSGNVIEFTNGARLDTTDESVRLQQSTANYIRQDATGDFSIYQNGVANYVFTPSDFRTRLGITFNGKSEIVNDGQYFRIRAAVGSHNGSIIMNPADDGIAFFQNGAIRHTFYADGTKSGGSIEIDNEVLGMSPIDSPQVLLSTLIRDVNLTSGAEHEIILNKKFMKSVANFAVFPSQDVKIRKGVDRFYVTASKDMMCDFMIYGERVGYEGTYWTKMKRVG